LSELHRFHSHRVVLGVLFQTNGVKGRRQWSGRTWI
jgi:hypothetical protein